MIFRRVLAKQKQSIRHDRHYVAVFVSKKTVSESAPSLSITALSRKVKLRSPIIMKHSCKSINSNSRNREEDLRMVSDAVISTMNTLKRTGISILKKVPDLYYDPQDEDDINDDITSEDMFSLREKQWKSKNHHKSHRHQYPYHNHHRSEVVSAYSTSCTSTSEEGEVSDGNTTITTRPSIMVVVPPARSFGMNSTDAMAAPTTPQSMGRPIIMVNRNRRGGKPKEVVFEVATHFETAKLVMDEGKQQVADDLTANPVKTKHSNYYQEDEDDDQDSARTRGLNLMWNEAQAVARRGQNLDLGHLLPHARGGGEAAESLAAFQLPAGITKDDIMVTIDIDDTARSSSENVTSLDQEEAHHQTMPRHRCDTDTISNTSSDRSDRQSSRIDSCKSSSTVASPRYDFEQAVQQAILDDLKSIYTATPDSAKLVLCIVICILSDGSMQHTYQVGGRVGLAELALNWRLFGADDLKVYDGGLTVQRKDFGFGPLELTEAEGEFYMMRNMAPQAAYDIVRRLGGSNEDFLAEI